MTYTQEGDRVTLEMTRYDYDRLTIMLGYALGAVQGNDGNGEMFWRSLKFVNDLNATNPNFTPYEIPEQYRG